MNLNHFQTQINRLAETYGGQHYKRERIELIWREVGSFPDSWLTRTVDRFIGELRQPPLVSEFREEASKERERSWSREKDQHARDAQHFFMIADDPTMRQSVLKTILDRMNGKVPDLVWNDFMKGLDSLVSNSERAAKNQTSTALNAASVQKQGATKGVGR